MSVSEHSTHSISEVFNENEVNIQRERSEQKNTLCLDLNNLR